MIDKVDYKSFDKGVEKMKDKQWGLAVKLFTMAINDNHYRIGICYFNRGISLFRLGSYVPAIEDFTTALEKNKTLKENAKLFNVRGSCHFERKEYFSAFNDFNMAINLNPKKPSYRFNRSTVYFLLEQYHNALEDINNAINIIKDDAMYYRHRAVCYLFSEKPLKAITDYTKTISLSKDGPNYYSRAGALLYNGDPKNAIEDYDKAIDLEPNRVHYYLMKGLACLAEGGVSDEIARETFGQAFKLENDLEDVKLQVIRKATDIFFNKDYEDAEKLYTEYIKNNKTSILGYKLFTLCMRGLCREKQNKKEMAFEDFYKVRKLNPLYTFSTLKLNEMIRARYL